MFKIITVITCLKFINYNLGNRRKVSPIILLLRDKQCVMYAFKFFSFYVS